MTGELSTRKGFRGIINVVLTSGAGTTNVVPTDPFNHTPEQINATILSDTSGTPIVGTVQVSAPLATTLPIATIPIVITPINSGSSATARVSVVIIARE